MRLKMRPTATVSARGTGIRNLVPAPVLDAVIAIAIAVLGLASGFGARAQHEHMPLAAIPLLGLMGLALYPRRRFPAAVLAAVAAMVAALVNRCGGVDIKRRAILLSQRIQRNAIAGQRAVRVAKRTRRALVLCRPLRAGRQTYPQATGPGPPG